MKIIRINSPLINAERETLLVYDNESKMWHMDSTITKHCNKVKKQGWTQTAEYVYGDGTVCGGVFEASDKAITFRDPNKKRVMSDKQMNNLHGHDDKDDEE